MELYQYIEPPRQILLGTHAKYLYEEKWQNQPKEFPGREDQSFRSVYQQQRERLIFKGKILSEMFRENIAYNRMQDMPSQFESRFESGNLLRVKQLSSKSTYLLLLQDDTNTTGYNQWFYFRLATTPDDKHQTLSFDIVNMRKSYSLFSQGMKVCVYSKQLFQAEGVGWHRAGTNLDYFPNGIVDSGRPLYSLHFEYTCEHSNDEIYFAYCYPYTFTDLQTTLGQMKVTTIGRSIAGNEVEAVVLGRKGKPLLVVMARTHPCETVSSLMMEGVIEALEKTKTKEGEYLLENCRVVLVPMVNPDGVVHGNSRSSYAGCDLNRRWLAPEKDLHPELASVKHFLQKLLKESAPFIAVDLHGHSGRQNLFFYGCQGMTPNSSMYDVRQLPSIMRRLSTSFSYGSYSIHPSRLSTARVNLAKPFAGLSYTLEASLMGSKQDLRLFRKQDYIEFGRVLVKGLAVLRSFTKLTINPIFLISKKSLELESQESEGAVKDDSSDSQKSVYNMPPKIITKNLLKVLRTRQTIDHSASPVRPSRRYSSERVSKTLTRVRQSTIQKPQQQSFATIEESYTFNFRVRRVLKFN